MLGTVQQYITLHLFKLVASFGSNFPRLVELSFPHYHIDTQEAVSDLLNLPDIPEFRCGILSGSSRLSSPVEFAHLCNIHTMEIPTPLWLNSDLQLPQAICHLRVTFVEDSDSCLPVLYNSLVVQSRLRERLKSLIISIRKGEITEDSEDNRWRTESNITFPCLHRLELTGVPGQHATRFLKSSIFPSLSDVSLH